MHPLFYALPPTAHTPLPAIHVLYAVVAVGTVQEYGAVLRAEAGSRHALDLQVKLCLGRVGVYHK